MIEPKPFSRSLFPLLVTFVVSMYLSPVGIAQESGDLIACGGEEITLIDPAKPESRKWTWKAKQSPQIPPELHETFRSTDDCKPYEGDLLLITSSSGGVALIHRGTKHCLFLANSRNAHSACLLPNRQIAVASSFGGDQLQFFNRDEQNFPATVVQEIPLQGAHGTVWDSQRKSLWALGEKELLEVVADIGRPPHARWRVTARTSLPSVGGHDLSPYHDRSRLFVTTNSQVLIFDRDARLFSVADGFGNQEKIKSVDRNARTGRITFHQATPDHWWSDTIRFTNADPVTLPNQRLYKVRWDHSTPVP